MNVSDIDLSDVAQLATRELQGKPGLFFQPVFAPCGRLLACCNSDFGVVALWETQTGTIVQEHGPGLGLAATFSHDSSLLAMCGRHSVVVADLGSPAHRLDLNWSDEEANEGCILRFDSEGRYLVMGTNWIRVWSLETGTELHRRSLADGEGVLGIQSNGDGTMIAYTCDGLEEEQEYRNLIGWDIKTNEPVASLRIPGRCQPVFCPDARHVILWGKSHSGKCEYWDMFTEELVRTIPIVPMGISEIDFLDEDFMVLTDRFVGSTDKETANSVEVWELSTGKRTARMPAEVIAPSYACAYRHGMLAVVVNDKRCPVNRTTFWSSQTAQLLAHTTGHPGFSRNLTFSPDGQWFASVATAASVEVQMNLVQPGTIFLTDLTSLVEQG